MFAPAVSEVFMITPKSMQLPIKCCSHNSVAKALSHEHRMDKMEARQENIIQFYDLKNIGDG